MQLRYHFKKLIIFTNDRFFSHIVRPTQRKRCEAESIVKETALHFFHQLFLKVFLMNPKREKKQNSF